MIAAVSPKRPDELDDLALMRAAATGDEAAAAAFFKRFHGSVLGFLSRMIGRDDPELDDLVQATFLTALDSAERFEGRSQVRTWVLGIAANKARTHRRGAGRRRTALAAIPEETQKIPSPSDGVKREQLRERLATAVDGLSAREREAFLLCDVEGVGGNVAAETLGVPQGTMWRRLHDARAKLRKALAGER